jgi:hypothetical protein
MGRSWTDPASVLQHGVRTVRGARRTTAEGGQRADCAIVALVIGAMLFTRSFEAARPTSASSEKRSRDVNYSRRRARENP